MKSLIPIVTASLLSATLISSAYAIDREERRQEVRQEINKEMQDVSRASKIIGTDLKNSKGDDLGDIKDLVIDPMRGQVAYVVVSYGGLLGMGDKLFAIPWSALRWSTDTDYFVLNMDKDTLKNAPGFDEDQWPDSSNKWEQQRQQLNQFYRVNP